MIRLTVLTLAMTSALTGVAAAQYAVRGGPLPPQRGPSLYTGAYAPSFYSGAGPVGYAGPGAGAGYLPNGGACPPYNGMTTPFVMPQTTTAYSNYYYYYQQQPSFY